MARLTVRNLDDAPVAALKARAARNGRSTEAEHRRVLAAALNSEGAVEDYWTAARALRARLVRVTAGAPNMTELSRRDRDTRR